MIGAWFDNEILNRSQAEPEVVALWPEQTKWIETDLGKIRVQDTGGLGPVVIMVPDGPAVIEHHQALVKDLSADFRVVVYDQPGFGFSYAKGGYGHRLEEGVSALKAVMDALNIAHAHLSFTCANGYYALHATQTLGDRVGDLILAQTPDLQDMLRWTAYVVPKVLSVPVIGQTLFFSQKRVMARKWFDSALPKSTDKTEFKETASRVVDHRGCFCLASLVQGLKTADDAQVKVKKHRVTMVWGDQDRTHKFSTFDSLRNLAPNARIERFADCGHMPNLEQPQRFAKLIREVISVR